MGKKKFIDKKKAITFKLIARDSSDPYCDESPGGDRVFVRVDNNRLSDKRFFDGDDVTDKVSDLGFSDAEEDNGGNQLPETVRKENLELGFPDDGYNYLSHLREIKNTGNGSAYFQNRKAKRMQLPRDVKAYDASRVEICSKEDDTDGTSNRNVAAKTYKIRVQKAVDPDVAALLDESDESEPGSEDEVLEEDFVIQANHLEEDECFLVDNMMPETTEKSRNEKPEINM